jgi:hypothetical protein
MTSRPHERKRRQLDERTVCHLHFVASDWGTAPARPVPVGMGRLGGYQCVGAVHEWAVHFAKGALLPRYDVERDSKLHCKIAHDAKRVGRGDAFPLHGQTPPHRCISRTHDQNQPLTPQ